MLLSQPLSKLSSLTFIRPIGVDELYYYVLQLIRTFVMRRKRKKILGARVLMNNVSRFFFLKKTHWKVGHFRKVESQ